MTSAYLGDKGRTRFERVRSALKSMGPAVLAGVTMTNLPGMIVLKFATAKIIEVYNRLIKICKDSLCKKFFIFLSFHKLIFWYFFRMGFTLTLVGFIHGIVFLPVLLTYIGPRRNPALNKNKNSTSSSSSGISNEAATKEFEE